MNSQNKISTKCALLTNKGKARAHNEDSCFFGEVYALKSFDQPVVAEYPSGSYWIGAVADGIGGQNAGEQASKEVVATLSRCNNFTPDGVSGMLQDLNRKLFDITRIDSSMAGMGSTVAGLCYGPEGIFAFSVGDSRVYRQQDRFLAQITVDDSMEQVLINAGQKEAGPIRGEKLHAITQAIGGSARLQSIEPHIYPVRVSEAARFLICTDGLTDMLSLDAIEAIMAQELEMTNSVVKLFEAAMAAGGKDNITIMSLEVKADEIRSYDSGK